MSGDPGMKWRFLIVEDKEDFVRQLREIVPECVDPPDSADMDVCTTFDQAADRLKSERFDLLILDLKDDSDETLEADANPAGLKVFEALKKTRFVPIVFYTALAHKVRAEQTSFVRVVEKTESITRVKEEVRRVLATGLPALSREVEEAQRSYMWDFVTTHWKEFTTGRDQADVAYLLARRLAIVLERLAAKLAQAVGERAGGEAEQKAHPMMMYLTPPLGPHRLAGDILRERQGGVDHYWLVLTPSCDFAQGKVKHAVLAKCDRLTEQAEYASWSANAANPSNTARENLVKVIVDNRKGQHERFKFLPGTFFLPDLLIDFQQLRSVGVESLDAFVPVAALDSPFAESVLARFARYFGRLGTPDLDGSLVLNRLQASLNQSSATASPSAS